MIRPHITNSDFDEIVQKTIFKTEGKLIAYPSLIKGNDNTLTYGYGFTFIRKNKKGEWDLYDNLNPDLAKINITLTKDERKSLNQIVLALKSNNKIATTLLLKFTDTWKKTRQDANHNPIPLSSTDAKTLYDVEIKHATDDILARFKKYLGNTYGQQLYDALDRKREMVALLSMNLLATSLVGKNLVKALWKGERAEAWEGKRDAVKKVRKLFD